jgi:hypothetical protein
MRTSVEGSHFIIRIAKSFCGLDAQPVEILEQQQQQPTHKVKK